MIYTAIYFNTNNYSFSRSVVMIDESHDRSKAYHTANKDSFEFEKLVCLVPGNNEAWAPVLD